MKLKAFTSTSAATFPKDRHLELFLLMIVISIAFAFAHVSIVSDLNSQIQPLAHCSTGCQNFDNSEDLVVAYEVSSNHSNTYDKTIQGKQLPDLQHGSPLTMWIVHNFGTIYTSVTALVIVLGCTCSIAPSNRRSS